MKYPILLLLVFAFASVQGQDQHFSQFFASPLTLNPALSGTFDGKYRVSMIYRDQDPFQTFAGAIDLRFPVRSVRSSNRDAFGVGFLFYNDKIPEVGFSNNQINVMGAYHKSLGKANTQFLSAGFQLGLAQRNFTYENLFFEDQFSGNGGFGNPTAEILPANNFAHADLAVGLNYAYAPDNGASFYIGGAMHHVLEPEISFYYNEEDPEVGSSNTLYRKYTGYVNISVPIGPGVRIQPRALVYAQGPHLAMNAGTNFRFLIDEISGTALHAGGWARPVKNAEGGMGLDAIVGIVGIEYNNFLLGFSYDAQLEAIGAARDRRGAFELSIAYLGEYDNETVLCPKF